MSGWVACLDASVLIPMPTADTLLRFAHAGLYRPVWSDQILVEVKRNLVAGWESVTAERAERRIAMMRAAFPEALVPSPGPVPAVPVAVHPKDRHVVTTAVVARADVIVTDNVRHFARRELAGDIGLLVQTANEFLVDRWAVDRRAAAAAIADHIAALGDPPRSRQEQLEAFRSAGLGTFARVLESDWNLVEEAASRLRDRRTDPPTGLAEPPSRRP